MKKKIVLILLFVLYSVWPISAQSTIPKLKLGAVGGYDFYSQNDLKFLNQSLSGMLPFEVAIVDDFKPVSFWGGYAQYALFKNFYLGPSYEYHYTGSRVGARDYSGLFSYDQYVHVHQIGLKSDYLFLRSGHLFFEAEINAGVNLTSWKMDNYLQIGDNGDSERQTDYFKGVGWYLSPALKLGYMVIPRLNLTGSAAYSFDLKEKYHYKINQGSDIIRTPDWNGLKLSMGVEFLLK